MKKILVACLHIVLLFCVNSQTGLSQPVLPEKIYRSYKNPVFDYDFPDPNLLNGKGGYFYAYSTETNWTADSFGGPHIIPILRSKI